MLNQAIDVIGIGNAIVDVIAQADDGFLAANGIEKGAMTLIDAERAETLYAAMGPGIESSGGSAANTMAGLAGLGGAAAYIGRVKDDLLGAVFRHDIRAAGVRFDTPPVTDGNPTARCLILVTPDAQRSMNTFLGASVDLGPADIDDTRIAAAAVTYLEGYLWDKPLAKDAFLKASTLAHRDGRKVALSLSDRFCVDRHRADFLSLVEGHVDILFANEQEILALYQAESFPDAVAQVRRHCDIAALTRSEKGAVIVTPASTVEVSAEPVARVVDTTGAGDLFAAGFLFGYTKGRYPADCARLGAIAAAEVIGHMGARPETDLKTLARARGFDL